MKKLSILLFVALLGYAIAQNLQDSNDSRIDLANQSANQKSTDSKIHSTDSSANHKDSHQTSSEWEVIEFMQGDEVERKKEALDSCYKTQKDTKNCADIVADWESLCAYGGEKYCLALYRIYESLRKDKNAFNKIIATLRQKCDSGEATACLALGEFYETKTGAKKALPYFQKACDLGFSSSCAMIVARYFDGDFQHLDKKQIKLYFDKALQIATEDCQRGANAACEMIRYRYEPLRIDIDSKYLPKIADDWEYLAYNFSWELEYFDSCMKKYAKHCDEILLTISNSCNKGEGKYCVAKGVIIYLAENKDKGIAILDKSCNNGYAPACARIGRIFTPIPNPNKPPKKVDADKRQKRKKGIAYTKKACDLGSYLGCAQLAETYYLGLDNEIPKDKQKAQLYFDKALQIATRDCQRKDGWESPFNWQNEACKALKDLDKIKANIDSMK